MFFLDPLLLSDPAFLSFLAFAMLLVGPCLGSFASAMAHRAPRQQSWIFSSAKSDHVGARSACPHCGGQLKWYDLLPIISWVCLRGKCRMCGHPIGVLYPALEVSAMILSLLLLYVWGAGLPLVMSLAALPFLLALFVISWKGYVLSDQILIAIFGLAVIYVCLDALYSDNAGLLVFDRIAGLGIGALLGLLFYWLRTKIFHVAAEDSGAPKLLAIAGLWFGFTVFPVFLIIAGGYGLARAVLKLAKADIPQPGMAHAFAAGFLVSLVAAHHILAQLVP